MIAGALLLLGFGRDAHADEEHAKLIRIIRTDRAYKVRMQAIRVLLKQLEKSKEGPTDEIMRALSEAALTDDQKLVRGMACVALGKLGDWRAEATLQRARSDSDSFVRKQATDAMGNLTASRRVLVVSTDRVPGVIAPTEMERAFESRLLLGFGASAGDLYLVGERKGVGFHMKGSIAELSVVPATGGSQVTIVVKVAIASWPDNNLRHVISARASAKAKVAGPTLAKLQLKLLEAAVSKAIQDSMAQIGGG